MAPATPKEGEGARSEGSLRSENSEGVDVWPSCKENECKLLERYKWYLLVWMLCDISTDVVGIYFEVLRWAIKAPALITHLWDTFSPSDPSGKWTGASLLVTSALLVVTRS